MSENGNKPEDDADKTGAPEVEAEVVEETDGAASAFDETPPDVEEALAGAEEELGGRKSTLTPGVMLFFAFVIVAVIALGVWRFQSAGQTQAPTQDETGSIDTNVNERSSDPDEANEPVAVPIEPQSSVDDAKIGNLQGDDLKPEQSPPAQNGGFLPPVTKEGAEKLANSVEEGAKEAMRRIQEAEAAVENGSENQSADEVTGFDVEEAETDSNQSSASSDAAPANTENEPPVMEQGLVNRDDPIVQEPPGLGAEKLANDLDDLRRETARLEGALKAEQARNVELAAEIASLRESFETALAARDERYAGEISAMRTSLQKIQNTEVEGATDKLKATLALRALQRKVEAGAPFASELTAVAEYAPEEASKLAPYAHDGVPTEMELQEGFDAAARAGLAAAGLEKAGGGVSGVIARAQSLVSVRPAAPQTGDTPRAVISRAEHALGEGDLTSALNELASLPPSAQEAMTGWVELARSSSLASSVLNTLSDRFAANGSE
ncbi:mitofilin family membrane protein [Hyphococcus flavus]|uniref:Mitofilin family membrane protein n=1 Tax=Hyphococcus flavus TaxID=1866326 RepID=A0AAE9ZLL0_9PROT|nr:mitofilin family membrane protein [Hyphococcus flavus]WDI32940.1 mitofilin family membrane protein [Hyphococcus flavus]